MAKNMMLEQLAINGGPMAKTTPNIPMYPGGLEIGDEEKKQLLEVIERKYLFRYYGPSSFPRKSASWRGNSPPSLARSMRWPPPPAPVRWFRLWWRAASVPAMRLSSTATPSSLHARPLSAPRPSRSFARPTTR